MYLSYSGFKKYDECPRAYWHSYVNKTQSPTPDNRVGMLYGSIVGVLFETFYNRKMWKLPDPTGALLACVDEVAQNVVRQESRSGVMNWKDPKLKKGPFSLEEVLTSVREAVPNGIAIIRRHKLLGTDARAEEKLDHAFGSHMLGGRCDFTMTPISPLRDRIILDGKGSAHRDKYVDVRQLLWYSLLSQKKKGFLPDQVAFVFWRSEPELAVDWVTPTTLAVEELRDSVLKTIDQIEAKKKLPIAKEAFHAKASPFACRFCPFVFACPEGEAMTSKDRPVISTASGVEDVALDD